MSFIDQKGLSGDDMADILAGFDDDDEGGGGGQSLEELLLGGDSGGDAGDKGKKGGVQFEAPKSMQPKSLHNRLAMKDRRAQLMTIQSQKSMKCDFKALDLDDDGDK